MYSCVQYSEGEQCLVELSQSDALTQKSYKSHLLKARLMSLCAKYSMLSAKLHKFSITLGELKTQFIINFTSNMLFQYSSNMYILVRPTSQWGLSWGATWVNFCWVCAAGFLEPLPHYSLFCGQLQTPSQSLWGKNVIFATPTQSLSIYVSTLHQQYRHSHFWYVC